MKCPKCNSENVQMVVKEVKPNFILPLCLVLGGIGLMFLGFFGAMIGAVLGLIVGGILASVLPSGYQSVLVCNHCGHVSKQ